MSAVMHESCLFNTRDILSAWTYEDSPQRTIATFANFLRAPTSNLKSMQKMTQAGLLSVAEAMQERAFLVGEATTLQSIRGNDTHFVN